MASSYGVGALVCQLMGTDSEWPMTIKIMCTRVVRPDEVLAVVVWSEIRSLQFLLGETVLLLESQAARDPLLCLKSTSTRCKAVT